MFKVFKEKHVKAVFEENKRPCNHHNNVAMVYVVGPDSGKRVDALRVGVDSTFSVTDFLLTVSRVSFSIVSAVAQYNQCVDGTVNAVELRGIKVLRFCLLSGGSYKHPDATKV